MDLLGETDAEAEWAKVLDEKSEIRGQISDSNF
jgi:hypothetical protein